MEESGIAHLRKTLVYHLRGGFAPLLILLREFHPDKAGVVLEGLHFSAHSLLQHMHHRQQVLLRFMESPEEEIELWPQAVWPDKYQPDSKGQWRQAISSFEADVEKMVTIVSDPATDLLKVYPNEQSIYRAAATALHHNAYHIGQLKTVGRQLGVW